MKVMYERVAGIDVHKDMIKVAVRSPGEKPWTRKTEILEYRTFYGVLQQTAADLRRRGVTHVVMEASGVYTEPVPLEYSIEWLTCAIASRLDVGLVSLPGASQDRLPAHVPGARPGRPGLPQRPGEGR
jgi:hypothetical protein